MYIETSSLLYMLQTTPGQILHWNTHKSFSTEAYVACVYLLRLRKAEFWSS